MALLWSYKNVIRTINFPLKKVVSTSTLVLALDALMKDQVWQYKLMILTKTIKDIKKGYYEILLISPESLLTSKDWRDILQSPVYKEQLVGVVVDEAHCVKKW